MPSLRYLGSKAEMAEGINSESQPMVDFSPRRVKPRHQKKISTVLSPSGACRDPKTWGEHEYCYFARTSNGGFRSNANWRFRSISRVLCISTRDYDVQSTPLGGNCGEPRGGFRRLYRDVERVGGGSDREPPRSGRHSVKQLHRRALHVLLAAQTSTGGASVLEPRDIGAARSALESDRPYPLDRRYEVASHAAQVVANIGDPIANDTPAPSWRSAS